MQPSRPAIAQAIDHGINFLAGNQLATGQFKTYGGPEETLSNGYIVVDDVFTTSAVLHTLVFARGDLVQWMTKKALLFLQAEMEGPGVWRYWTRVYNDKNRAKLALDVVWNPPDVEDTVLAAWALERHGIPCPRTRGIVLANRRAADGLFYSWIVPRPQYPRNLGYWQIVLPQYLRKRDLDFYWKFSGGERDDIDGGLNASCVLYLGERPETQGAIDYLIGLVRAGREASACRWYRPVTIFYYISRAHFYGAKRLAVVKDEIVERVQASLKGADGFHSPLEVAQSIATLLNLHHQSSVLEEAIDYLLATQTADGAWRRGAFYGRVGDYAFGDHFFGSEELTTGICIEALARYQALREGEGLP